MRDRVSQSVWRSAVAVMAVVIGLLMVGTTPVFAEDEDERVVERNSNTFGNTYGEWSAQWWQWVLSIPAATNPNLDTTGANCGMGQAGPVWFLAGAFGGTFTRFCTVPAGKALFFAILNNVFGSAVFDCNPTVPDVVCNLAALRQSAAASMDSVRLQASLDGEPLRHLSDQRVQSPEFTLTVPAHGVINPEDPIPAGTYTPQVSDGYWIMLKPLRPGRHTIHFSGEITAGVNAGFFVDVTYNLTIQ